MIQCIHVYMHGLQVRAKRTLAPQPAGALMHMPPASSLKDPITSQPNALSVKCLQVTHMLKHDAYLYKSTLTLLRKSDASHQC